MNDDGYLTTGIRAVTTQSSVLTSSSPFLNHAGLRDWISTHYLRRSGPDRPTYSDTVTGLLKALDETRDVPALERLIAREREINPRFAAWVDEAYIAQHGKDDFLDFADGTVGGIYRKYLFEHGFELNLARSLIRPRSDLEFIRFRFGQIHDYEHIIAGGGFNTLGEIMPYFVRQASLHRHLSPELAGALSDIHVLGGYRLLVRAGLNYPAAYMTALDCMTRAIRIGRESEPIFMMRFEDVLHLYPADARVALGVRHAEDLDTVAMSRIFDDLPGNAPTTEAMAAE